MKFKELMEKDVLNRIRWDDSLIDSDFSIEYYDRISGMMRVNFREIEICGDYIKAGDSMIPMHRIRKIYFKGEVAWAKRAVK